MATSLSSTRARFFDKCGKPLAGGKIYAYEVGTTTPKKTYTDAQKQSENTHPVALDVSGSAPIFLDGAYRVRVLDCRDMLIEDIPYTESWIAASELEGVKSDLTNAVQEERQRAEQAEKSLLEEIEKEQGRAMGAEQELDKLIAKEQQRATQEESSIYGLIEALEVGNYAYLTYDDMIADAENIPSNSKVTVTNDQDEGKNGEYQYDGENFTKSNSDPVAEAKKYIDQFFESLMIKEGEEWA